MLCQISTCVSEQAEGCVRRFVRSHLTSNNSFGFAASFGRSERQWRRGSVARVRAMGNTTHSYFCGGLSRRRSCTTLGHDHANI